MRPQCLPAAVGHTHCTGNQNRTGATFRQETTTAVLCVCATLRVCLTGETGCAPKASVVLKMSLSHERVRFW